jgi:hypothetical protein
LADSIIVTNALPPEQASLFAHSAGTGRSLALFVSLNVVTEQVRVGSNALGLSEKLRRRQMRTNEVLGTDRSDGAKRRARSRILQATWQVKSESLLVVKCRFRPKSQGRISALCMNPGRAGWLRSGQWSCSCCPAARGLASNSLP